MSEINKLFDSLIDQGGIIFDGNDYHKNAYLNELKIAKQHFQNKWYTETCVRLGRATECLVYFIAKKCNHQGRKVVKTLKTWSSDLLGQGRILAEEPDSDTRAKLVAGWIRGHQEKIKEITLFAEDPQKIEDQIQTIAFPPESRNDEVPSISSVWEHSTKKKLPKNEIRVIQNKISLVMERRNFGAHADPRGHTQEIKEDLCIEMCHSFADLFQNIQSRFLKLS